MINCANQVISAEATDQIYKVRSAAESYILEEFDNDEAEYCPLTYTATFDKPNESPIQAVASGLGVTYQTDTNEDVGVYVITVEGTGPDGVSFSVDFNLEIIPDCSQ